MSITEKEMVTAQETQEEGQAVKCKKSIGLSIEHEFRPVSECLMCQGLCYILFCSTWAPVFWQDSLMMRVLEPAIFSYSSVMRPFAKLVQWGKSVNP